jgi:hypothetical protein
MTVTDTRPPNPRGEALVAELRWVHDMIRRDLRTVRQMAADVASGRPADEVRAGIRSLAASGPLWQLKINCLHYCRLVHSHHGAESMALFPALRQANPGLSPVVDKLEADHRSVATLLGEVETAAQALGGGQDPEVRERLTLALHSLSETLLAHLSYEEEQISDTLRTFSGWPSW